MNKLTDFAVGIIVGFIAAVIIFSVISIVVYFHNKEKELNEYAEKKWKLRLCAKILSIVLLMSFLRFPMYAEPLTEQETNLTESEMKSWSDLEVELMINEISEAAYEAIEQAAALAAIEREAAALREAQQWRLEAETAKRTGRRNAFLAAVIFFVGGLAVGVGGTLIIQGR